MAFRGEALLFTRASEDYYDIGLGGLDLHGDLVTGSARLVATQCPEGRPALCTGAGMHTARGGLFYAEASLQVHDYGFQLSTSTGTYTCFWCRR